MKNTVSYIPNKMKVIQIKSLSRRTKGLVLEFCDKKVAKDFEFIPGQFVIVSVFGFGEVVLAITSTMDELPRIEVAVRSVGNTTSALHRLKVGDELGLRGPFGRGISEETIKGKDLVLLAGGIGLAPLRSLIKYVEQDKHLIGDLKILVGAKTPEDLIYKSDLKSWAKFAEVEIAVDKCDAEWKGFVGQVTQLLTKNKIKKDSIAIVCGPEMMYKKTKEKLLSLGLEKENIYFMFERRMKCGIGKCQHCVCGGKYVCTDGPLFSALELETNWEALV